MFSVGITASVGHLLIYLKKGQKSSRDCDLISQSAVLPVFPPRPVGGKVIRSDVLKLSTDFNLRYLAEFFHGERRIWDDRHINPFTMVKFLKILFGIPFTGFAVRRCHKFSAAASVRENVDRVYLPLSQQIGRKHILFFNTLPSNPEAVYLILFQFVGLYRLLISLI